MAESMSIEAVLSAVDQNFTKTMEQAVQSLGEVIDKSNQTTRTTNSGASGIKEMASSLGLVAVGAKAFQVVSDSVGSAISRIDTLNNATRTFTNMGFNTKQISSAMDGLKVSIKGLPTSLNEAVKGVQMIAASTGDLGKSQQVYSALNDAIIGFGGNTNDVSNAIVQLSQAFANGKIDAQTWNSMMQSNLGPTLNAVAKKMGITTAQLKDGLSTGKISVADFQNALIDLDKNGGGGLKSLHKIALDSTSGISTSIENAKTAITRGVADMIGNVNKGLSSSGLPTIAQMISNLGSIAEQALSGLGTVIPMVMAAFSPLIKMIGSLAKNDIFKSLVIGAVGFLGTIKVLSTGIKGVQALMRGFETIKAFTSMIAEGKTAIGMFKNLAAAMGVNPWVLLAAAIVAVVAALVYFFTQTKTGRALWAAFTTWLASAWQALVGVATTVWNAIGTAITTVVNVVKAGWQGLTSFLTALWTGIVAIATGIWNGLVAVFTTIVTAIEAVWTGISTFFTTLWTGIVTVATTIWNSIVLVVTTVVTTIEAAWSGFTSFISSIWEGIVAIATTIWDTVVSVISGAWSTITGIISGAISVVQSVISAGFNAAKTVVASVMAAMSAVISSIWGTIKGLFRAGVNFIKSVVHVDLSGAGRAIMQSLWNGMKSVWEGIKNFVSNIAGWIKSHKGPISLDRRLLIPAGNAIMRGLNEGLVDGFKTVQSTVTAMTNTIAKAASVPSFTDTLNALNSISGMNINADGTISSTQTISNVNSRNFEARMTQMMATAVDKLDNVNQTPVVTVDTMNRMRQYSSKADAQAYVMLKGDCNR